MSLHRELNQRVTRAIFQAERLDQASPEARAAWRAVSDIEAAIAELTMVDEIEGIIARVGAVTAAVKAGDDALAEALRARYQAEGCHEPLHWVIEIFRR